MGTNSTVKSYTSRSRRVDPDLRVEHLRHRRAAAETAAETIAAAVEITADTDRTDDGTSFLLMIRNTYCVYLLKH